MKVICSLIFVYLSFAGFCQLLTPYEKGDGNQTATYQEGLEFWESLANQSPKLSISPYGSTDSGLPLHLIELEGSSKPEITILINNGIHPGEPDGTDATMMYVRDMLLNEEHKDVLKYVKLAIIPFYNVGGTLNRNSHSRANQNGPESYGFRGNAKNLDLNRDFIKMDSKNAMSFAGIFHQVNPDFYIETHVSNGADYQYTITIVETQHNKLGGSLGVYFENELMPGIHQRIQAKGELSTPYVNVFGRTPEQGFSQFFESPRYSTGYAALFHVPGIMMENHMLKPYPDRVKAAYTFLCSAISAVVDHRKEIKAKISETRAEYLKKDSVALSWVLDRSVSKPIEFKGYEATMKKSDVSDHERLYYDRSKPFTQTIPYYNEYKEDINVVVPDYYIIPQSWPEVLERLKVNNVKMRPLKSDSVITVEKYRIEDFKTGSRPYEGHFPHRQVTLSKTTEAVLFRTGDILISLDQEARRFLIETLEPQATDSYFSWNFFDPILQQKEYFSSYVFEDTAVDLLNNDADLRNKFDQKMSADEDFQKNPRAQLDFIYRNSEYYEKSHLTYPVYRVFHN